MNSSKIEAKGTVTLTELAKSSVIEYQRSCPEFQNHSLRLYLEGKGCDGFYYGVTFDHESESDILFPQRSLTDNTLIINVIVDPDTMQFVEGSNIDWIDDERGRGFLVDNPNQKSFRGKFFKRESWKNKLMAEQKDTSEVHLS